MVAFDCVFLTQENADTFPILFCRDKRHGQTGATSFERKDPTSYLISFLDDCRILEKDENEPSMKVFQEAMIHSCVEVAVREMKRQCRILKFYAEHNTSARITSDISLLHWIPHYAVHFLNKMTKNLSKMEKAHGAIWSEILVSLSLEKKVSTHP